MRGMEKFLWQGLTSMCLSVEVEKQMVESCSPGFKSETIEPLHDVYILAGGKETLESIKKRVEEHGWDKASHELIKEIEDYEDDI